MPPILTAYLGTLVTDGKRSHVQVPLAALMMAILAWDFIVLFALTEPRSIMTGIQYLGKRLIYFLIYIMAYVLIRSRESFERAVWALILATPFLNASVLFSQSEGVLRSSGIIEGQETSTALFVVLVLCLSLGVWPSANRPWQKVTLLISVASCFTAVLATGSKTGLVLTVLGTGLLLLRAGREAAALFPIVVGIAAFGFYYTPDAVLERFERIDDEASATFKGLTVGEEYMGERGSDSLADRYYIGKHAMSHLIPQAPFIGLGTAHKELGSIDNFFLVEWLYHGLIGLALWAVLLFLMAYHLIRTMRFSEEPIERGAGAGLLVVLFLYTISCFTVETFYLIRPMEGFMLLMGVILSRAPAQAAAGERARPVRSRPRRLSGARPPK